MKTTQLTVTIRDLVKDYNDDGEEGVLGYGGKLDIRPPYQREFIYNEKNRAAVINTVKRELPLNAMFWMDKGDGTYEIVDGQQRTLSICKYVKSEFSYEGLYFHNLQDSEQDQILDYELMIFACTGTDKERLDWFRTINIAGEKLNDQELRNAVYHGSWVSDAKRRFSKINGFADQIAQPYTTCSAKRQDYLETAIKWINDGKIEEYMATHQHDPNANELWLYFQGVINWVEATFPKIRKEMKKVDWGPLYKEFKDNNYDSAKLESEISKLIKDKDVTNKKGIYPYVLTREEKHLNLRAFEDEEKSEAYERQEGICVKCKKHFSIEKMEADHITPWSKGGKTISENCQMLCAPCNRTKSNI